MPHMCTRCKNVFEDGVDILRGCPVCGQKKFLFVKSDAQIEDIKRKLKASEIGGPYEPWPENDDKLSEILKSPSKRRGDLGKVPSKGANPDKISAEDVHHEKVSSGSIHYGKVSKDNVPSESVSQGELADIHPENIPQGELAEEARAKKGGLLEGETRQSPERREEIQQDDGDMVESIRMSEQGTYELNLPTLFDRDELVMSVKDGTYLIDLSSAFKKYKKD